MSSTAHLYGSQDNISMRDEFTKLITPYGRTGILRRVIRDSNNQPVLCDQCRHRGKLQHASHDVCSRCLGIGYLSQEYLLKYYQWPGTANAQSKSRLKDYDEVGVVEMGRAVMYVHFSNIVTMVDKIIEVANTNNGDIAVPIIRKTMYDIQSIDEYRLDSNRTEYYRLFCNEQKFPYFGQPLYERASSSGRTP